MSMKLDKLVERCGEMNLERTKVSKFRKKRVTVMQAIYALYIIEAINLIATIVLWLRVFFLHCGGE